LHAVPQSKNPTAQKNNNSGKRHRGQRNWNCGKKNGGKRNVRGIAHRGVVERLMRRGMVRKIMARMTGRGMEGRWLVRNGGKRDGGKTDEGKRNGGKIDNKNPRQDHEKVVSGPESMVLLPPRHYCIIANPIIRDGEGKPRTDEHGQIFLQRNKQ
jgi:hypothetical protein